jgi:uncharacterized protein (UPF0332 family)
VTPETAEHLDKAREYLTKARNLLDVMHYNDEAGRAAYLAGFHAAQALISERTGRVAKTHDGVNSQFNLLTRDDPRIDDDLRGFLGRAYNLKAVADYETGPRSVVPLERVELALITVVRFVEVVAELLPQPAVNSRKEGVLATRGPTALFQRLESREISGRTSASSSAPMLHKYLCKVLCSARFHGCVR